MNRVNAGEAKQGFKLGDVLIPPESSPKSPTQNVNASSIESQKTDSSDSCCTLSQVWTHLTEGISSFFATISNGVVGFFKWITNLFFESKKTPENARKSNDRKDNANEELVFEDPRGRLVRAFSDGRVLLVDDGRDEVGEPIAEPPAPQADENGFFDRLPDAHFPPAHDSRVGGRSHDEKGGDRDSRNFPSISRGQDVARHGALGSAVQGRPGRAALLDRISALCLGGMKFITSCNQKPHSKEGFSAWTDELLADLKSSQERASGLLEFAQSELKGLEKESSEHGDGQVNAARSQLSSLIDQLLDLQRNLAAIRPMMEL